MIIFFCCTCLEFFILHRCSHHHLFLSTINVLFFGYETLSFLFLWVYILCIVCKTTLINTPPAPAGAIFMFRIFIHHMFVPFSPVCITFLAKFDTSDLRLNSVGGNSVGAYLKKSHNSFSKWQMPDACSI